MAEDLTKGLNHLLLPKFTDFQQRIEHLEAFCKELGSTVHAKEDKTEVDALREHFGSQLQQVDSLVAMVKDKMGQLDDLRSRELRALHALVEQKASTANLNLLRDQIQQTNVSVSTKAEVIRMDQLSKQVEALSEQVCTKAAETRAEHLGKQLHALSDALAQKVDFEVTDAMREDIKELSGEVAEKATAASVATLGGKLQALNGLCNQKAQATKVEHLAAQLNAVEQDMSRKAEDSKVEHVLRSVNAANEELANKAHSASVEQALRHVHTLTQAVSKKAEIEKHETLIEQLRRLADDLVAQRAEVDRNTHGLDALARKVAQDGAKLKNLASAVDTPQPPLSPARTTNPLGGMYSARGGMMSSSTPRAGSKPMPNIMHTLPPVR